MVNACVSNIRFISHMSPTCSLGPLGADVLKVSDVSRAANVSSIQTYVINNDRVIFIRRRPLARIPKGPSLKVVRCSVCSRALQDNCLFCSLQCKLDATDAGRQHFLAALPCIGCSGCTTQPWIRCIQTWAVPLEVFKAYPLGTLQSYLPGTFTAIKTLLRATSGHTYNAQQKQPPTLP